LALPAVSALLLPVPKPLVKGKGKTASQAMGESFPEGKVNQEGFGPLFLIHCSRAIIKQTVTMGDDLSRHL
jgi:hypothetical protein